MTLTEHMVVEQVRRLTLRELRLWVREGWVQPAVGESGPVFDDLDVARIRLLCDLRKEMSLSADALPVILTLIDQMHSLRRDLRLLSEALEHQPEDLRRSLMNTLAALRKDQQA